METAKVMKIFDEKLKLRIYSRGLLQQADLMASNTTMPISLFNHFLFQINHQKQNKTKKTNYMKVNR